MSRIVIDDHVKVGKGKQTWKVEYISVNGKVAYLACITDAPETSRSKYLYRPYATARLTKIGEHLKAKPGESHICPECGCHRHQIY